MADALTCYYRGLHHRRVEAGGVWYCPNNLCTGPGAAYFRSKLESYKEDRDGHTIDPCELVAKALLALKNEADFEIQTKIKQSVAEWLKGPTS